MSNKLIPQQLETKKLTALTSTKIGSTYKLVSKVEIHHQALITMITTRSLNKINSIVSSKIILHILISV